MYEDKLTQLLERCESPIESELLEKLYPRLPTSRVQELCAQYMIDYYNDMPVTIPDFAFPNAQIAVYCDGFSYAGGNHEKFRRDRLQLRELQLRGWIVLRFAGSEINYDSEMVVETIQRAIARRDRQRAWRSQQQQERQHLQLHSGQSPPQQKPKGGLCGVIVLACVIVGILATAGFYFLK